jgi:hypothetical protein
MPMVLECWLPGKGIIKYTCSISIAIKKNKPTGSCQDFMCNFIDKNVNAEK